MTCHVNVGPLVLGARRELSQVMATQLDRILDPRAWTFSGDSIHDQWWEFSMLVVSYEPERGVRWKAGLATTALSVLLAAIIEHPQAQVKEWPLYRHHHLCYSRGGDARGLPRPSLVWKPDLR